MRDQITTATELVGAAMVSVGLGIILGVGAAIIAGGFFILIGSVLADFGGNK